MLGRSPLNGCKKLDTKTYTKLPAEIVRAHTGPNTGDLAQIRAWRAPKYLMDEAKQLRPSFSTAAMYLEYTTLILSPLFRFQLYSSTSRRTSAALLNLNTFVATIETFNT